jgi:hypothetical protein
MALLCLGEIGRRKDLSSHVQIENIVIESFQSPFEEIKSAASYALGNIAVGNLSKYLPFILDQIDNQQKKQYLLLHSLKEVSFFLDMVCKLCSSSNYSLIYVFIFKLVRSLCDNLLIILARASSRIRTLRKYWRCSSITVKVRRKEYGMLLLSA